MAATCAIISPVFDLEDGTWYLYQKPGFSPMVLFHKHSQHSIDVRECHRRAGWHI